MDKSNLFFKTCLYFLTIINIMLTNYSNIGIARRMSAISRAKKEEVAVRISKRLLEKSNRFYT